MKKSVLSALLFLTLLLFLTSCDMVAEWIWEENYEKEETMILHGSDSDQAKRLCERLEPLFTTSLDPIFFDRFSEKKDELCDLLLSSVLAKDFALYTGQTELYEAAREQYPGRNHYFLIPRADFDYALHDTFDEVNVRAFDTAHFDYLDDIDAFTAERQPLRSERRYTVYECTETKNTFRLLLRAYGVSEDGRDSGDYGEKFEVLFVKTEGEPYIKSVWKR